MSLLTNVARKDLSYRYTLYKYEDVRLAVYTHKYIDARIYGLYIVFNGNYYQYYYSLSVQDLIGNISITEPAQILESGIASESTLKDATAA